MLCGLPVVLSIKVTYAVSGPSTEALKVTVTVSSVAGFSVAGQVLVWVKSAAFAPVMETLLTVIAALPLLPSGS